MDKLRIEMYYWDKIPQNNLNRLLVLQLNILHILYILSIFQNPEYSLMGRRRRHLQGNQNLVCMLMLKHHKYNQQYNWNINQDYLRCMKNMVFYN